MKKNYFIIALLAILFSGSGISQETQKNFINYQGVARNADNALMVSEQMTINIALKFGNASAASVYEEHHTITTDANGVFSLLIGNGSPVTGDYDSLPWGSAATFVSVSMNGKEIGTTEMMAVPYAISSGDADNQSAAEVAYNNATSGLTATTTQDAIDELVGSGAVDADSDPSNELQTLSFDAGTNELSLSEGNSVIIPSGDTDADADPTNEIQTISFDAASNKISLTDGGEITIPSGGTDADADPSNEFQTLSFDSGTNELSLSDGNSVTIPSGGTDADADPTNEIQNISLSGTELTISDGSTIDLAPIVPPGGTDDQNAGEVTYDNTASGLTATDSQSAIDELASGGLVNTDEQDLSLSGTMLQISDGTGVDLAPILSSGGASTGLEAITEEGNTGWRLSGRDPEYYAPIGNQAVDMSISDDILELDGATGESSVAMGFSTKALGSNSTAMGQYTISLGNGSTAMGAGTRAFGANSTAMGVGTTAYTFASTVIGRFNARGVINESSSEPTDPLFEIGNGLNHATNSNALTVLNNGNTSIGNITPTTTLDVDGDLRLRGLTGAGQRNVMADADGNLVIGAGGGGSSLWTANGDDIYYNTGNIGLGTTSPTAKNHIAHNSTTGSPQLLLEEKDSDFARLAFKNENSSAFWNIAGFSRNGASNGTNDSRLSFYFANDTETGNKMSILGNGNVGIGTTNPSSTLEVNGDIKTSGEVHTTGTGTANMVPIAYGKISQDGSNFSGSGNFTSSKESTGIYFIVIPGMTREDIRNSAIMASRIRTIGPGLGFIVISGSPNVGTPAVVINTYTMTGAPEDINFSFVVYKN